MVQARFGRQSGLQPVRYLRHAHDKHRGRQQRRQGEKGRAQRQPGLEGNPSQHAGFAVLRLSVGIWPRAAALRKNFVKGSRAAFRREGLREKSAFGIIADGSIRPNARGTDDRASLHGLPFQGTGAVPGAQSSVH